MNIIEAIYSGGVFKPLGDVPIVENQRVRLTVELAGPELTLSTIATAGDLRSSDLCGLWSDRDDVSDSREFLRRLREHAEHAALLSLR